MKLKSSKEVYRCSLFGVTEEVMRFADGFEIKRSIVRHPGSAVIMPVDERGRVLLVRQYRVPILKKSWELPAGTLDPGETPLQAAKRELAEETGYRALRWTRLARFYPSPGLLDEKMTIYLARDLTAGEASPMDDERIEARWVTRKELGAMIQTGKIEDAKTMIAFCRSQDDRGRRGSAVARLSK